MSDAALKALAGLLSALVWPITLLIVLTMFRRVIRERILSNLSHFSAFGVQFDVEAEWKVKGELDAASKSRFPAGGEEERTQVARRAGRSAEIVHGARVLLVNDRPGEMRVVTNILASLGAVVGVATTTETALSKLGLASDGEKYDVVLSDMKRERNTRAGLDLLDGIKAKGYRVDVIVTVGRLDPGRGTPPGAFGITNRVDELMNLIFDVLERKRG